MEVFIQIFKKNWITIFFSIALLSAAIMLGNKNSEIETLQNEVSYLEDQILTLESEKKRIYKPNLMNVSQKSTI
jgi:hypothetical protein